MGWNALHEAAMDGTLADVEAELARPNGKELAMEKDNVSEDNVHTHTAPSWLEKCEPPCSTWDWRKA